MSTTALEKQQTPQQIALKQVSSTLELFKAKILNALPKNNQNADQFISSVLATVSSTQALHKCTPNSIALAAYEAATLGLPVNKLQLAYLVPFGNEAKLLISYRGYIQLALDTGFVHDISAEIVYSNDYFKQVLGTKPRIDHEPANDDRGEPIAVYAIARLANGICKQVVMSKAQVEKIRHACSKSANGTTWTQHWEEMAKKTAIKRLCKTLPSQGKFENIARAVEIDNSSQDLLQEKPLLSPAALRPQPQLVSGEGQEPLLTEHASLMSQLLDLQEAIKELDKKAELLPNLEELTVGDLETLLEKKRKHYELIK